MKLITIRSQIMEVADRWREQYTIDGDPDKMKILKKLEAANKEKATPQDVKNIIGNFSWACPQECNECGSLYNAIVEVGEKPDYESNTARLCLKCLKNAIKLFDVTKLA